MEFVIFNVYLGVRPKNSPPTVVWREIEFEVRAESGITEPGATVLAMIKANESHPLTDWEYDHKNIRTTKTTGSKLSNLHDPSISVTRK